MKVRAISSTPFQERGQGPSSSSTSLQGTYMLQRDWTERRRLFTHFELRPETVSPMPL